MSNVSNKKKKTSLYVGTVDIEKIWVLMTFLSD